MNQWEADRLQETQGNIMYSELSGVLSFFDFFGFVLLYLQE